MKQFFAALGLCAALATPVAAQDTRALAETYTSLPAVQQMMADMFSPAAMGAQFAAGLPAGMTLTEDQIAQVGALMSSEFSALIPVLNDVMIEGSAETFTAPELEALIGFYQTPEGEAVMSKMQPFMQATMGKLTPRIVEMTQKIQPQLIEILQGG